MNPSKRKTGRPNAVVGSDASGGKGVYIPGLCRNDTGSDRERAMPLLEGVSGRGDGDVAIELNWRRS